MEFKTIIVGRVGRDAETKFTPNGQQVTTYNVACNPQRDKTVWVRITTWGKRAEIDAKYVKKGMLIKCEGTLQADEAGRPRTYKNGNGEVVSAGFELTAFDVKYLSKSAVIDNADTAQTELADLSFEESGEIPF